jgi:hypothetical protein
MAGLNSETAIDASKWQRFGFYSFSAREGSSMNASARFGLRCSQSGRASKRNTFTVKLAGANPLLKRPWRA